jgi:hypothetical protein
MKRLALTLALLTAMSIPAMAQRGAHREMKWLDDATLEAAKELGTSLTSWARTNVLPAVQSWKTQLDNSLTPADLAKLNELRRQAAALRERRTELAKSMRDAWKSGDYDQLKQDRDAMKALGDERDAILEQLRPIAEASRATLESIGEAAKPQLKQWADEARTIGEQWWEQNKGTVSPMAAQAIGRLMKHRHDLYAMLEPKLRTKMAVAHFMLWNGDDFTRQIDTMLQQGEVERLRDLNLE